MDKHGLLVVLLFLFMIALGRCDALNSRKLVTTTDPNGSSNANQDSSLTSPPPDEKKQNPSPVTKPKDAPTTNPLNDESKGMNDANTKTSSENSSDKTQDKGKSHDGKDKVEDQTQLKTFSSKYCKGNSFCSDQEKTMIACIQDIENGTNKLTLLVRNEQDKPLKVNVTLATSMNSYLPAFEMPGHGTEKVNVIFSGDKSTKVILNAGNGDCELRIDGPKTPAIVDASKSKDADKTSKPKDVNNPVKPKDKDVDELGKSKEAEDTEKPKNDDSPAKAKDSDDAVKAKAADDAAKAKEAEDAAKVKVDGAAKLKGEDAPPKFIGVETPISQSNLLDQLSFYSKQVTPIYGAYFAFLVALVIGGSWAMCSFRKRRINGGVPYQELEMGLPESSNAMDVETAEGWDQDWDDDDWDEDKAIRSPGARTISSNGLTSRATKKDGWDADWET